MLEFTFSEKEKDQLMRKLSGLSPRDKAGAIYRAFLNMVLSVERSLKENVSGAILNVRSGRLRSSIGSRVSGKDSAVYGVVGSGVRQGERVPYANIHETGETITPRRVKWLTIPLEAALTPSGVARGKARDFADTFFAWRGDNLFLFQKKGKDDIVPLFILKKSVDIPARRYMSQTLAEMKPRMMTIMSSGIKEAIA